MSGAEINPMHTRRHVLTKQTRIMIVEDDPVTVFLHEQLLKDHCTLVSVKSGYEALAVLKEQSVDVVLMDINLGDINMDGIKTMRMIRREVSLWNLKIIAVTAFANNRKWYMEQGFDELVLKPLSETSLLSMLYQVLNKKQNPFQMGFSLN